MQSFLPACCYQVFYLSCWSYVHGSLSALLLNRILYLPCCSYRVFYQPSFSTGFSISHSCSYVFICLSWKSYRVLYTPCCLNRVRYPYPPRYSCRFFIHRAAHTGFSVHPVFFTYSTLLLIHIFLFLLKLGLGFLSTLLFIQGSLSTQPFIQAGFSIHPVFTMFSIHPSIHTGFSTLLHTASLSILLLTQGSAPHPSLRMRVQWFWQIFWNCNAHGVLDCQKISEPV